MLSRFIKTIPVLILFTSLNSFSQFEPNPEFEFYTIETEHFYIHYHKGTERTANIVAKIAEEIYEPITSLYQWSPKDKTSFIINDESDYSNGATDYYGNRIEIAAVSLDFDLRGTHNWLRNVITHEFTHVIQVPASMKFGQKIPAFYLQFLNYEKERRPDILYGYPNVIVSYPFAGSNVPAWFAEGTAQYQRQQSGYDYWDAHRDMIVRMRSLDDKLLSWEEMGQFASVTTYKAESIYNQGFGLVRYISEKYGQEKLREVSKYLGSITAQNVESPFRKAIGKSGSELYNEWKAYLKNDYSRKTENVRNNLVAGEQIAKVGFANYYPQFSPDGKKISYLSNKTYDYGSTSLYIHEINSDKEDEQLIASVSGSYSWSPDGKRILFARRSKPSIHDASVFDLYEFDIANKEEKKITTSLRAHAPSYSPDGNKICFVVNKDGTQNLFITNFKPGEKIKGKTQLTNFSNGEQIYSPKWSPDGNYIFFDYSKSDQRNIAKVKIESKEFNFILSDEKIDYRSPNFSPDGKYLYFNSDKTGIFNIYRVELEGDSSQYLVDKAKQMTNVLGGAFMPSIDKDNNLSFASWTSDGYKINLLKNSSEIDEMVKTKNAEYIRPDKLVIKEAEKNELNSAKTEDKFDWVKLKSFNDNNPKILSNTRYNNVATPLFLVPVLRFDNYTKDGKFVDAIKPGVYFFSQDVLGRMGIFGGAFLNKKFERDLFLQFDYNNGVPFGKNLFKKIGFVPSFSIAGYNVTRKTTGALVAGLDTINVDITYDLLSFDFGMAFKIINSNHKLRANFNFSKYSSKLSEFVIPSGNLFVPASSTSYFTGRDLSLTYTFSDFSPNVNDDINPLGRYVLLKYDYNFSSLNPTLIINEQGQLVEVFDKPKFHQLETRIYQSFRLLNSHSLSFDIRGGTVLGKEQDSFFDFYPGGFPGMKGYPFFSISGNRYASANVTYRIPLAENLKFNFLQFYFDKIFFSVYGDVGNAWNQKATKLKDFKKDIGAELRVQAFSYYVYPTAFAFNAAYGLDRFSRIAPTTTSENKLVTYGKEWRFYFTVLFGFDFFVDGSKKMMRF